MHSSSLHSRDWAKSGGIGRGEGKITLQAVTNQKHSTKAKVAAKQTKKLLDVQTRHDVPKKTGCSGIKDIKIENSKNICIGFGNATLVRIPFLKEINFLFGHVLLPFRQFIEHFLRHPKDSLKFFIREISLSPLEIDASDRVF